MPVSRKGRFSCRFKCPGRGHLGFCANLAKENSSPKEEHTIKREDATKSHPTIVISRVKDCIKIIFCGSWIVFQCSRFSSCQFKHLGTPPLPGIWLHGTVWRSSAEISSLTASTGWAANAAKHQPPKSLQHNSIDRESPMSHRGMVESWEAKMSKSLETHIHIPRLQEPNPRTSIEILPENTKPPKAYNMKSIFSSNQLQGSSSFPGSNFPPAMASNAFALTAACTCRISVQLKDTEGFTTWPVPCIPQIQEIKAKQMKSRLPPDLWHFIAEWVGQRPTLYYCTK